MKTNTMSDLSSDELTRNNEEKLTKAVDLIKHVLDVTVAKGDNLLTIPGTDAGMLDYRTNVETIIAQKLKNKFL